MSPEFMASRSWCSETCPCVPLLRRRIRRYGFVGFALIVLALAAVAASLPVDGLPGVGLAVAGTAGIWSGWYLIVRRTVALKAELAAATAGGAR